MDKNGSISVINMGLKFKIIFGYSILMVLLAVTILFCSMSEQIKHPSSLSLKGNWLTCQPYKNRFT